MRVRGTVLMGGLVMLAGTAFLVAAPAANRGDSANSTARRSNVRLTKPWSEMNSLTDAEKNKILEIHRKAVEQIHEIETREKQDIMALLTPAQKKEVEEIEARDKQEQKERRTRRPTTQPTGGAANSTGGK